MATSDTPIRVTSDSAAWLSKVKDEFRLASVGVVVERLIALYGDQFLDRKAAP